MYKLKTKASFDSAHFLKDYEGKCSNIHGHRWTVEIEVGAETLEHDTQNRGMVVDFSNLKKDLREIADYFDHSLIMETGSLRQATEDALIAENLRIVKVDFRPTAENFAKYIYDEMTSRGYKVIEASVYETPNNVASYCE
ncbi:MAG: 6-carboxytetrahydropterin synthase QueD [Coprococcus sp.]|uniref:6-carboxytetrahydropterin synthase QueD n=1 Tax=unclassified Coprococcus TaxID=2684943 RepID=UPI0002E828B6|nr:6-carboxytetrahydropterin synthase QueD [Coprococcus sp. ART55/1]